MLKKNLCTLLLLMFMASYAAAQNLVTGSITDNTGLPIAGVSVTYRKTGSEIISGYSLSNSKGNFSLSIAVSGDSIQLYFQHIDYKEAQLRIKNKPGNYAIKLNMKIRTLPNVIVRLPPVFKKNDTLNYNIDAFKSKQDQVIGDVIKKLPGIEMDGDRILYQGKPIQKYFINGLDLLEGRYSLANNNLPVDAVEKIQVIENNQPVKILDSLIFSDKASLNIKLKKFTTTGSAKMGVGLSPFIHEMNITPMTFNKNFQSVNSLQSNNTGNDVVRQLNAYSGGNMFDYSDFSDISNNETISLVGIQDIASPNVNEKRWLDNNVNLLTGNFLQKLQNNMELKGSISYVNDYKRRAGQSYTTLFNTGQNIDFSETIHNTFNTNDISGSFILLKNEKNIYLKNNFQVSGQWLSDNGNLMRTDANKIFQQKDLRNFNLSNRLALATFLWKQLVVFHSYAGYSETPQNLSVIPGQFENILNDSLPYQGIKQSVRYVNFKTDNYLSFVKGLKSFSLMPRIGFSYQNQQLRSHINITNNNVETRLDNDFVNHMSLSGAIVYLDIKSQFKSRRWRIDVNTPLRFRYYQSKDHIRNFYNPMTKLTFEPGILTLYQLTGNLEARLSSVYANQFGSINTLYNGFLLTSYRNLQKFNATLPESNNWNSSLYINFKNPLKSVFAGISYSYSLASRNYIFRNELSAGGYEIVEMDTKDNIRQMQSVSANYSRYFAGIKTIVKTKGDGSWSRADYILNNSLENMKTHTYGGSLELSNTSLKYMNVQYVTSALFIYNTLSGKAMDKIITNSHALNVGIFPIENQTISMNTDYYTTNLKSEKGQVFIDLLYRVSLPKRKADMEINCLNLLNNKTYTRLYSSDYSIIRNYFQMRPRQVILTIRFKF